MVAAVQYARVSAPPDSADDIELELKRAHTQQQMLNAASHALWRLRAWERHWKDHHGSETP